MSTMQLGIVLAVFLILAIILRIKVLRRASTTEKNEESLDDPMQILFFDKVVSGSEKIHFLDISGSSAMQNLMVLKNLFQSEGIPYYCEFEKFNAIYGGVVTSIRFYIIKNDYDSAINIVTNYNKSSVSGITVV